MNTSLNGHIVYLAEEEVKDYVYNPNEIKAYASQALKFVLIQNLPEKGVRKIKIDVLNNSDFSGGYIVGFFYPNLEFLGHFHHSIDSKKPTESMSGTYSETQDGYIIEGLLHEIPGPDCSFYLKVTDKGNQK